MNIPKYSLENRKVIYFFLAILLIRRSNLLLQAA